MAISLQVTLPQTLDPPSVDASALTMPVTKRDDVMIEVAARVMRLSRLT